VIRIGARLFAGGGGQDPSTDLLTDDIFGNAELISVRQRVCGFRQPTCSLQALAKTVKSGPSKMNQGTGIVTPPLYRAIPHTLL
jgi:hypothetical protein